MSGDNDDIKTKQYFLYPSALFVCKEPAEVSTVLGSCISVCMYDTYLKIGGINHFMLPIWDGKGLPTPRFGDIAIERMLGKISELGSAKKHLVAKIFGGAEQYSQNSIYGIGKRNTLLAESMLEDLRIPIVSSSVGGKIGRRLVFNTATGQVYMKYITH